MATFQSTPVFPDGSLALADLDIDGGTDIGADIVDADLLIVDDGAGGTNRKTAASRLKTYIGGGITNAQTFRLTTSFTDTANPIASNWEEVDTDGYGQLGSNVSESSGVFSFSATGIYLIIWNHIATLDGDDRQVLSGIHTTTDNSNYGEAAEVRNFIQQTNSSSGMTTGGCFHQFDVTSTTNCKVRFNVGSLMNSSTQTLGDSGLTRTSAQFIRLGDT